MKKPTLFGGIIYYIHILNIVQKFDLAVHLYTFSWDLRTLEYEKIIRLGQFESKGFESTM